MTDICDCGEPRGNGADHRRCHLIGAIESEREFGAPPDDRWEP